MRRAFAPLNLALLFSIAVLLAACDAVVAHVGNDLTAAGRALTGTAEQQKWY